MRRNFGGCVVPLFIAACLIGASVVVLKHRLVPANWIPWAVPHLEEKPSWFAHLQINHLHWDGTACRKALARTPQLSFTPLADRTRGRGCGYTNVVRMDRSVVHFNYRPVTTCALAAALYWWEGELETLSLQILHTRLTGIDQLGTYACRNVNSQSDGSRSQHAMANAIDIRAFRFAEGKTITVSGSWNKKDSAGQFLRKAHDAACGLFNGVLGPDYNRLHRTHFHLDLGPYKICR